MDGTGGVPLRCGNGHRLTPKPVFFNTTLVYVCALRRAVQIPIRTNWKMPSDMRPAEGSTNTGAEPAPIRPAGIEEPQIQAKPATRRAHRLTPSLNRDQT